MCSKTHIVLSLDPTTLDLALGHKPVKTIEADGALVFAGSDSIRNELNQQLERICNKSPNGMLDISEDKLARLPPDGDAMMEWEEMEKLRSEVFIQLKPISNSTRAKYFAGFDLDSPMADALTFGARQYLRLRATLRDNSGAVLGSTPVTAGAGLSVRGQMDAAQMEAFDEDIFHALPNSVCSTYFTSPPDSQPHRPLYFTSLVLPVPTILLPILDMLQYRHMCGEILSVLKNPVATLRQAGLGAEVVTEILGEDAQDAEAMHA
ncbi:hypothetical protein IAT38_004579 [Cryptococcus sp. DSM 104549]